MTVSETSPETVIATASVTANSRKSRPTIPLIRRMGMKTASNETVIETMVKPISRAPRSAASNGRIPPSTYRAMFSVTTIASSTTKPVEMVSAISERLFRL